MPIFRFLIALAKTKHESLLYMNDKSIQGLVFHKKGGIKYGIPGVKVSNGREVVLTNKEGQYELPRHGREGVIFICKPSDYRLPNDSCNG